MPTFVIEREKIISNAREILSRADGAEVIAVVKGRGYGFGTKEYIDLLYNECNIRYFAVTEPSDALDIRSLGFRDIEIIMLRSTCIPDELSALIENDIIITIGSTEAAVAANDISAQKGKVCRAHIKIDTGMGRYGFLPTDFEQIFSVYTKFSSINACGLFTHFPEAFKNKKLTRRQAKSLFAVREELAGHGIDSGMLHFSNSAYLFNLRSPLGDAVRIGSAFTGRIACKSGRGALSRVGHLEGNICELRWLSPGSHVGYGGVFTAKHALKAAIIPVGYSDGFGVEKVRDTYRLRDGLFYALSDLKRSLFKKKLYVRINGKSARVLGHIGMTHTVCDVTNIPCNIGDVAEFDINPIYVSPDIHKDFI